MRLLKCSPSPIHIIENMKSKTHFHAPYLQVENQRSKYISEDDRDVCPDETQDRQAPRVRPGGHQRRRPVGE